MHEMKFGQRLQFDEHGIAQMNPHQREPHYEHAPCNCLEMQDLKGYEMPSKHPKVDRKEGPTGKGYVAKGKYRG